MVSVNATGKKKNDYVSYENSKFFPKTFLQKKSYQAY